MKECLLGAHTSTAGGVHNALYRGQAIGATTVQLFTSNQRQWRGRKVTPDIQAEWQVALEETGLSEIMSHDSYLINLGSPDSEALKKSRKAFREEVERCVALGITYLNFHPGSHLGSGVEECLETIAESLLEVEDLLENGGPRLLLETTAGQGSNVGCRFEELKVVIDLVSKRVPIGVCIDTCHIFAAGYDIRDRKGWDATLKAFDQVVGLEWLCAFHVNDSKGMLDSHKDRHASLGEGEIGLECFKVLMTHPKTRKLPKFLETPGGEPVWKEEIPLLRKFASGAKR